MSPTTQAGGRTRDLRDGGSTCHGSHQQEKGTPLCLQPEWPRVARVVKQDEIDNNKGFAGGKGDIGCEERHGPPRLRFRFKGEVSNSEAAGGRYETLASRAREKEDSKIAICIVLEWIRLIK